MIVENINISQEHFEIMQPIIVVARLFGLLPIKFSKYGSQFRMNWSLGYGIYSCLLYIILITATLLGIIHDLQEDEQHSIRMKDKKSRYVTCCDISIIIPYEPKTNVGTTDTLEIRGSMAQNLSSKSDTNVIEKFNTVDRVVALTKFQEKIFEAVESVNDCMAYGIHVRIYLSLYRLIPTSMERNE
ncbi:hypothetical protein NQ314_005905, partial [Rhamnusium bicolor]